MADIVDKNTRSRMMSGIRGANTKPEVMLRKALHAAGFRFRLNVRSLPGTPDIVLPKWSTVIQVHGCYWHRHAGCPKATTPSSNVDFWSEKFSANVKRDARVLAELHVLGWRTGIVWECAIGRKVTSALINEITEFVRGETGHQEFK
ncbi:MAG: DNA mismatch endonuclease Vsr [Rhodobacteraceae bacterium]|nr:MAG: DNA mismatch endonuclease Vsr [Paracoccaceae bacterium]